ncbi:hypothetical protein, partial [Ancylobacter polymorphus]|uniref:hypothetical protein n=1 Tax=Ancylobacter polymorphus TaxID=223390 RepID=UPI0036312836
MDGDAGNGAAGVERMCATVPGAAGRANAVSAAGVDRGIAGPFSRGVSPAPLAGGSPNGRAADGTTAGGGGGR